ncbi:MAG TPA: RtcB family protein, partial [Candidatus Nanoarchaeia archaeon]|nr:RtcB family protein [Candidatus Nanoarchaeia archaeon]
TLFKYIPTGVGCKGLVKLNKNQFENVMNDGVKWCVENGYGEKSDMEKTESHGKIPWADASVVSLKAASRGINQLGTLGSGNHYCEVQVVKKNNIYDEEIAKKFGLFENQVVVMVHCGSRGFGHQIATDHLKIFDNAMKKYEVEVRDRELSCAPFQSPEGQAYFKGMACAANMAFANRQVITHRIREAFRDVFDKKIKDMDMNLIYDVAHNIAKIEEHVVDGKRGKYLVHRKGSTRAFGPGNPELIPEYQETGQPVILGGSMETGSHLLVGTQKAMEETFGSTAHGSGRIMSRTQAKRDFSGDTLLKSMREKGIYVRSVSMHGLAEEAGGAYKDVDEVVETLHNSGISKKVVKLIPVGNIKG